MVTKKKSDVKRQAKEVVRRLKKAYPDATCALHFQSPVQLLVATILSAQCTDQRVNAVTAELFGRYPTAGDLARIPVRKLETLIQSTGFFRNKAKNIHACCQALVERFEGEVPRDIEELVKLPGIGRKTANVVLGTAYGLPTGVVVDTHVSRIVQRLGLSSHRDPTKIENDLMELVPKSEWIDFSHRVIHHGRAVCRARRPRCEECVLLEVCPRLGVA